MLLTLAGGLASAQLSDIAGNPHREAIESMVELGVLLGRGDGRFWPLDNLTRAEAAKVAGYLHGFSPADADAARGWAPAFSDVYVGMGDHEWAVGWINLIAREGIILGYGDGKYHPGAGLQMAQWVTILIRILGREVPGMAWPGDYNQLAHALGLTAGIPYTSSALVNRGEMARFSATAVYDVERVDGTLILETLLAMRDGDDPGTEPPPGQPIFVTIEQSHKLVAAGGGRQVSIVVSVVDETGAPVEEVMVSLHANSGQTNRSAQVSTNFLETDAAGRASFTYTTVAADDGRQVEMLVNVGSDDHSVERRLVLMAANQAAEVVGTVVDPHTGAPLAGAEVMFWLAAQERSVGRVFTDAQGRYEAFVPTGSYDVVFELAHRDMIVGDFTVHGSTYTLNYNKGVLRGVATGLAPGSSIMAIGPGFKSTGRDNWTLVGEVAANGSFVIYLRPGTYQLFVMGRSNPFRTGVVVETGKVTDIGTVKP